MLWLDDFSQVGWVDRCDCETENCAKSKEGQNYEKVGNLMRVEMIAVTLLGKEAAADDKEAKRAAQCAYLQYSLMPDVLDKPNGEEDGNDAFSMNEYGQELVHGRIGLVDDLSHVDVYHLDCCHLLENGEVVGCDYG